MTNQQELELLAEWLGIDYHLDYCDGCAKLVSYGRIWNPSPTGNDTDFLNMVAGRVDIEWHDDLGVVVASDANDDRIIPRTKAENYSEHNNNPTQAMKHAAYQVCLMAAREWEEEQNG